MALTKQYLAAFKVLLTLSGIKKGDVVKLVAAPAENYGNESQHFDSGDISDIQDEIGHSFTVSMICLDQTIWIEDEDGDAEFNVPVWCVSKDGSTRIKLNDEHDAIVAADGMSVKVGCQTIPAAAVIKLATAIAAATKPTIKKMTAKKKVTKKATNKAAVTA